MPIISIPDFKQSVIISVAFLRAILSKRESSAFVKIPDKRLYKLISAGEDNLFEDWSPEFRETSIINGLDRISDNKYIFDLCGCNSYFDGVGVLNTFILINCVYDAFLRCVGMKNDCGSKLRGE